MVVVVGLSELIRGWRAQKGDEAGEGGGLIANDDQGGVWVVTNNDQSSGRRGSHTTEVFSAPTDPTMRGGVNVKALLPRGAA